jgi:hypothetical protein
MQVAQERSNWWVAVNTGGGGEGGKCVELSTSEEGLCSIILGSCCARAHNCPLT